jgi:hypothetical protein
MIVLLYFMDVGINTYSLCVTKTNLMHYLSSVYFVTQPLHVSAIFVAHNQEVYCIYTTINTCCIYTVYLLIMGYKNGRNM